MKKWLLALICMVFMGGTLPIVHGQVSENRWNRETHYIVFEQRDSGELQLYSNTLVELAAPLSSLSNIEILGLLRAPQRNGDFFLIQVRGTGNVLLFQSLAEIPRWLRGEFHGPTPESSVEGHFFPLESRVFVVRVPVIPGVRMDILSPGRSLLGSYELDDLVADTADVDPRSAAVVTNVNYGPPQNRVDILIMGDGYDASESSAFNTDATNLHMSFFNINPLSDYAGYFNVSYLYTASTESGADHPTYNAACPAWDATCCGDTAMLSDPLAGTYRSTAFDAHYCAQNIHRLLVVDVGKIYTAAAAVPDWDTIMVLVNDATYGGSGGALATVSTHALAVDIAQHEFGHSFANLADEYDNPYPGYPSCSDISGSSPCEENVTDETTRALIKWNPWILPTTPVPTVPEWDPSFAAHVGLFQGARYDAVNMFRSGQLCMMQALGNPYCQIPSQSIILRLYNGGWGVPVGGISMIEPGMIQPPVTDVTVLTGRSEFFTALLLYPLTPPLPGLQWFVDGLPVSSGSMVFTYSPGAADLGDHTIRLEVMDLTPHVHPLMTGGSLVFFQEWTVHVKSGVFMPLINR
jgi:hypothetical protein